MEISAKILSGSAALGATTIWSIASHGSIVDGLTVATALFRRCTGPSSEETVTGLPAALAYRVGDNGLTHLCVLLLVIGSGF